MLSQQSRASLSGSPPQSSWNPSPVSVLKSRSAAWKSLSNLKTPLNARKAKKIKKELHQVWQEQSRILKLNSRLRLIIDLETECNTECVALKKSCYCIKNQKDWLRQFRNTRHFLDPKRTPSQEDIPQFPNGETRSVEPNVIPQFPKNVSISFENNGSQAGNSNQDES